MVLHVFQSYQYMYLKVTTGREFLIVILCFQMLQQIKWTPISGTLKATIIKSYQNGWNF